MSVSIALKDSGYTASDSGGNTGSITPSANKLLFIAVENKVSSGTADIPTVSGCNLTWVQVATILIGGSLVRRLTLLRALGASPTTGALTINFGEGEGFQVVWGWEIVEFTGMDTSGTNGSGAVVQSATNSGSSSTSLTVTLAAFGSASNATWGVFSHNDYDEQLAGTGFARDVWVHYDSASDGFSLASEFRSDNDTSVDMTWTNTARSHGIAVEIKAAAGGTAYTRSVAGAQGSGTGTLARKFSAKRALAGAQACGTGVLTRIQHHIRGLLAGAQACGTGVLTRVHTHVRAVSGTVTSGTGTLDRKLQAVRSVVGTVASGTGILSRAATYKRALAGAQQVGAGMLIRSQHRLRSLAGLQPASTGILSALKIVVRPKALKGTARAIGNWFKAQGRFKK